MKGWGSSCSQNYATTSAQLKLIRHVFTISILYKRFMQKLIRILVNVIIIVIKLCDN